MPKSSLLRCPVTDSFGVENNTAYEVILQSIVNSRHGGNGFPKVQDRWLATEILASLHVNGPLGVGDKTPEPMESPFTGSGDVSKNGAENDTTAPPEADATPDEAFELGKVQGFDEGYRTALEELTPPANPTAEELDRIYKDGIHDWYQSIFGTPEEYDDLGSREDEIGQRAIFEAGRRSVGIVEGTAQQEPNERTDDHAETWLDFDEPLIRHDVIARYKLVPDDAVKRQEWRVKADMAGAIFSSLDDLHAFYGHLPAPAVIESRSVYETPWKTEQRGNDH